MSGNRTISNSETRIEALQLQSSARGVCIPLAYGVPRLPANLLWHGPLQAIANTTTQSQGGKGGMKTTNTTYTYAADAMMALCEGQITGVARGWRGKARFDGGPTPSSIVTTAQSYTVPTGGGSVTVTHAADYAAPVQVLAPNGSGETGAEPMPMAEGLHYTRIGGTYTFPVGCPWEGLAVSIQYQYTVAGTEQTSLEAMGLSFAAGALGQATWPYLASTYPAEALGYSGLAYVYAAGYSLGTGAQVENHNFEVIAPLAYHLGPTQPDVDPALWVPDVLCNARYGAGWPAEQLGNLSAWSAYCRAAGLLMSPAITTQTVAAEVVAKACKLTNTAPVYSGGVLKFVPYADEALTGNGVTFTPDLTPVAHLTDDHFLDIDQPVKLSRKPQADAYNHVRVEWRNRANEHNAEVAEAQDLADIQDHGLRSADPLEAHWLCSATAAGAVADLLLKRSLWVRNTYSFKLPGWVFDRLEPMDIVTLTDARLALVQTPVRLTEITETEDDELHCTAEDLPSGIATANGVAAPAGTGFAHNLNAAPGSVETPVIFETPGALATTGLELAVAAVGLGAEWGGAHVWLSLDGSNYQRMATLAGGSRYGTLTAAATTSGPLAVQLLAGELLSGSAADATALNTLCLVRTTGLDEFLAYQTATLTGARAYTLSGTVARGAHGTAPAAHASGDAFVRVDAAVARISPVDLGYVGKTISIKLTSFNRYAGAEQSLADVPAYTYTITGAQVGRNVSTAQLQPQAVTTSWVLYDATGVGYSSAA